MLTPTWGRSGLVLHVASPLGERRLERWREAIQARRDQASPEIMRDYAAFHATCLHTVIVGTESAVARAEALESRDATRWRPEEIELAGLVEHGARIVAREMMMKAALVAELRGDPLGPEPVALLEQARRAAPWDPMILGCWNETRFHRGDRDEALLGDLATEVKEQPSLAAAAEALGVAEALGRARAARVLRARVVELSRGSKHEWMAEARALFGRPSALARLENVERALSRAPVETAADPGERAVYALYGADPARAAREAVRALGAQRDALEWAALVGELGEDAIAPVATLPEAPLEAGPGAVAAAIAALRARLDAPSMEGALAAGATRARAAAELAAIEAIAAGALALADAEPALTAGWIAAIGSTGGLAAALDAALSKKGDAQPLALVGEARRAAESALASAVAASWLGEISGRVRSIWPLVAQLGGAGRDLARGAADLEARAAIAADAAARAEVDARLTALLDEAGRRMAAPEAEADLPAGLEAGARDLADDGDGFKVLRVGASALERSRRELGTPEWALAEGLRQVGYYNLARGRRDLKMLQGTRDDTGGLWELRHRDARHPVRVLYRYSAEGPVVIAILAKQDDAHQRRAVARVRAWGG